MNTPTAIPQPAPWTPCRYIPRPHVVALTGLPPKPTFVLDNQMSAKKPTRAELVHNVHVVTHLAPVTHYPDGYAEDDTPWWFEDERWIDQPYIEPPVVPFALLAPWSVTTELPAAGLNVTPLVKACQRKEADLLIKAKEPISAANGHAPLAYVKDDAEHARVMAAYKARVRGDEGAQDTWNAISAGSTLGLTVDESLRRFGRPVVLA